MTLNQQDTGEETGSIYLYICISWSQPYLPIFSCAFSISPCFPFSLISPSSLSIFLPVVHHCYTTWNCKFSCSYIVCVTSTQYVNRIIACHVLSSFSCFSHHSDQGSILHMSNQHALPSLLHLRNTFQFILSLYQCPAFGFTHST